MTASFVRQVVYWTIPCVLWMTAVLGYTVAYGTFITSVSMPNIIPAFYGRYLGGVVPAIGFMLSAIPTVRGSDRTGPGFIASIVVVGVLVVAWFIYGWKYGVRYQGLSVVMLLALLNLATFCILLLASLALRRFPGVWRKFAVHTVFWVWIGWLAFPWLGEWP